MRWADQAKIAHMKFHTEYITFYTKKHREYINMTPQVETALRKSGIKEGMILVSAMHITAGVYVNDAEDTGPNDALWSVVNRIGNLKYLIIETAFSDKDRGLAELSKHLCPSMLGEELAKLERPAEVYITHLKPAEIELTMQEIEELPGNLQPRLLQNNHVFEF